jgi:GNAT superfamily N-acetyltransferase
MPARPGRDGSSPGPRFRQDGGVTDVETLLDAYDRQMRGGPTSPPTGVVVEHDGPLLRVAGQFRGFISPPRDVGVRGAELDRLIERQRDFFAARGESVEWKYRHHDQPADLPERLRAAGFVPEQDEAVLVGVAADMVGNDAAPALPDGVELRRVTDLADLRRIAELETTVWNQDWSWLADDLAGRIDAAPDDVAVLVAEAGGVVVSAAWLVYRRGTEFAALWGGSTLPRWRGKGIYKALVARRAQLATERGFRYLQVDASDDSAPILRRLGFHHLTTTTPYVWSPEKH